MVIILYVDIIIDNLFTYPVVAIVMFNESTYSVNEDVESVQPVLVLSIPSSTNLIVQVTSVDVTATGE